MKTFELPGFKPCEDIKQRSRICPVCSGVLMIGPANNIGTCTNENECKLYMKPIEFKIVGRIIEHADPKKVKKEADKSSLLGKLLKT